MTLKAGQIAAAQDALKARYYECGASDGIWGPKTRRAVWAFEVEHDLRANDAPAPTEISLSTYQALQTAPIWARGIDVSHWQDDDNPGDKVGDLQEAQASGISWVIIKAGGADSKHGDGLYQDREYKLYLEQARACGLIVGKYYFHHFSKDPVKQAEHFFRIAGPWQKGDLPPALDVEDYVTKIRGQAAIDHVMKCLVRIEELFGKKPLLYTSASLLKSHYADFPESPLSKYDLWIPAYGVKSPGKRIPACFKGQWKFWQAGYDNNLAGFGNDVDRNFFRGTLEELCVYVGF